MESDIKTRLNELSLYLGKSIAEISAECGYNRPQAFYDLLNGKTSKISPKMAKRITEIYRNISIDWLVSGIGDMLKDDIEIPESSKIPPDLIKYQEALEALLSYKDKEIAELKAMIEELKSKIARLQRTTDG